MLTSQVFLSGQLTVEDMTSFAGLGFSRVVNHRPDDEEPGQPHASTLAQAALAAGMIMVHAPVRGLPQPEAVEATRQVLDALGSHGKAVMFCRSGMRSATAWAMAERLRGVDAADLREAAAGAGYDLSRVPL
ncbi:TIGR01244 family sulfur transferase [Brevundimonas sp.]|uniref:TIGR01244 family sulfur transferase n=1 Tax=Brevundimonas sp. TaxID=1871086 RepID=UPI0027316019|nr:TIGR01244 family sulfur transferase [Brevundimonas sp.]MDP1913551.1 TIGR01244 family sulfur transferase [Brevundimonas sp.]